MFEWKKYVVFSGKHFVMFDTSIKHINLATMLEPLLGKPTSAGFVDRDFEDYTCWGGSLSLNLKADPKDTELLYRA